MGMSASRISAPVSTCEEKGIVDMTSSSQAGRSAGLTRQHSLCVVVDPCVDQISQLQPRCGSVGEVVVALDRVASLVRRGQRVDDQVGVAGEDAGVARCVDHERGGGDLWSLDLDPEL